MYKKKYNIVCPTTGMMDLSLNAIFRSILWQDD